MMKFSKWSLLKLKNKKLKFMYLKQLKRNSLNHSIIQTDKRLRLAVYRSNKNLYAQIINDKTSKTLISCSTLDRNINFDIRKRRTCGTSKLMGKKLAKLSLQKNITKLVFDRGPYPYHGQIKSLADGARISGLQF